MINIREFEQTTGDYAAVVRILNETWQVPRYTLDDLRREDEEKLDSLIHRRFVAEVNEQIVGFGSFEQREKSYHPQRFWIRLDVLPNWRKQGIGTQLYTHMLSILRAEYKANELHADTTASRDHSVRFLKSFGFVEDKRDPKSRLTLAQFDSTPFQGLEAKIAAMDIEIKRLSDLLLSDPKVLYKVYELHQRLVQDVPVPAPRTKVNFESWQNGYSMTNPYYLPEANFMALHAETYIGLTSLWGLRADDRLYTGMSGVRRKYRRKGVMTLLKLRSIEFAQAQGVSEIMTSNNSENPMLQINRHFGFKIYDAHLKFLKRL